MKPDLSNKKVAVVIADGFEQSEFEKPVEALEDAGARVEVVSLKDGKVKGWKNKDWGDEFEVDKAIDEVRADDYDALLLPGGVMSPDTLRWNEKVIAFVKEFYTGGKPVAAICHGPWTLIETGMVKGRRMTSYPSIRTDLVNAGASWENEEVVIDRGLVTSRSPKDLPAFCEKMLEAFSK